MGARKFGTFIYQNQKTGPFTFCFFCFYHIPGGAEKWGGLLSYIGSYPPPPEILIDEALLSISSAGRDSQTMRYIWIKSCMLINFNIVQQLVCETATMLCRASF